MIYIRPFIKSNISNRITYSNPFRFKINKRKCYIGNYKSGTSLFRLNWRPYTSETKNQTEISDDVTKNIYNDLIKYANEGNIELAQEEFRKLLESSSKPNIFMFNALLKSISLNKLNTNKKEIMITTLESMEIYEIRPDYLTFNICFKICSDINDMQYTLDLLKKMKDMNIKPRNDTYLIIVTLLKNLDYENMYNFWNRYLDIFSRNLGTYYSLTKMLLFSNHMSQIKEIYKDMLSNNIELDNHLLLLFLNASYASGVDDFSLHLFDKIFEEWKDRIELDINIFHSLVKIASKFSPSHIYLCIDLMEQKGIPYDQKMYEYVLMSFGKFGEYQRVMNIFNKAKLEGMLTLKCYYGILFSCKVNLDADNAWNAYKNVLDDGFKPDELFLNLLIEILAKANRNDLLEQLNDELSKIKDVTNQNS